MVLSEAIKDYGEFMRHELGHTASTYHAYVSWQRNFARWLEEHGHPAPLVTEITPDLGRRYSYGMSSRNLRPRTIRGALHALRARFAWLHEKRAVPSNPAKEVRLPKKDAAQQLLVTDEDLARLLEVAGRQRTQLRRLDPPRGDGQPLGFRSLLEPEHGSALQRGPHQPGDLPLPRGDAAVPAHRRQRRGTAVLRLWQDIEARLAVAALKQALAVW